ncbi:MAG: hypothetical protein IKH31_07565 [Clostridia bacterium]|nr:hypothetical protein [Clostridia bacterium]
MKRILIAASILLAALMLFGCANGKTPAEVTPAPTAEAAAPTEAPTAEPTEAPTAEPTPKPTAEPTPKPTPIPGEADLCIPLDTKGTTQADIDFDGRPDIFEFFSRAVEGCDAPSYELIVRTAAGVQYDLDLSVCDEIYAWIVDCDPTDGRAEVIVTSRYITDDWATCGLRLDPYKSAFKYYDEAFGVSMAFSFTSEGGLSVLNKTTIWGPRKLSARATLDDDGFRLLTEGWDYIDNAPFILKQKIKVQLVNDDGSLGDTVSVKSGKKLTPLSTDGESWVTVLLPDGSTGRMTVEIKEGPDEWGVFLNGKDQDTIAYLPYSHF